MALRTNLLQVAAVRNSISSNDEILGFASDYTTEIRFTFSTLKSAILGGSGTGAYLLKDGSEAMTGGLQVNPTWNSAPTIFSALKVNVTDTSSDSSSLLFDLQKDSSSLFNISKSGQVSSTGPFVVGGQTVLRNSSGNLVLGNSSNTTSTTIYGSITAGGVVNFNNQLNLNSLLVGGIGSSSTGGTLDWNDSTNARSGQGFSLLLGSATNGPGGSNYYHPFSFEYSFKNGGGNMTQFAVPYNSSDFLFRRRFGGSWSSWARIITSNDGATRTTLYGNIITGSSVFTNTNNIGLNSLSGASSISDSVFIGSSSGQNAVGAFNSVGIGYLSLYGATQGSSIGIGYKSLYNNSTLYAVGVGYQACESISSSYYVHGIGFNACNSASGDFLIGIGNEALSGCSGSKNIAIGSYSCKSGITGGSNTNIGFASCFSQIGGSFNVSIGTETLYNNLIGSNNTTIGSRSGFLATSGNNILIGFQAGDNVTTGSNNLIIGYNVDAPSAVSSNQMSIGNAIFGTTINGSGTSVSTGRIGLFTNSPASKLDVVDNSQAINTWTSIADCIADASFRFKGSNNANGYGLFMGYANSANNAQGIQAGNQVGNSSVPLVFNPFGGNLGINKLSPTSQLHLAGDFAIEEKVSAPSSLANNSIIYSIDNGSSKTNLMAQMPSGSAQKILGEPPTLSGNEPGTVYLIGGENFGVDTSGWFSGDVTHYAADLPRGVTINSLTGLISGSITYTPSETFTVRAYNGIGYLDYSFSFEVIKTLEQMQIQAKAWFGMDSITLQTDLVVNFDGINQALKGAFTGDLSGDFTIAMWVKPGRVTGTQWLVSKGAGSTSTQSGISIYMSGATLIGRIVDVSLATFKEIGFGSLTANTLYHIALVRDGSTLKAYLNGALVTTLSHTVTDNSNATDLAFASFNGNSSFYQGTLQHVSVLNRPAEISSYYNSGVPKEWESLTAAEQLGHLAFYALNEPRGARYDSVNSNHLTAINNPSAAHGPVEYQAQNYAGVTKWINQGLASGKFGDVTQVTASGALQLINGKLVGDGVTPTGLETATGSLTRDYTQVVVGKADPAGPITAHIIDSSSSSTRGVIYLAGNNLAQYSGTASQAAVGESGHTRFVVFAEYGASTAQQMWINGNNYSEAGEIANFDFVGLTVGASYSSGLPWHGEIEAVLLFDRKLTSTERISLTQLLSA